MKKIIISTGTILAIAVPTVLVVSCGNKKPVETKIEKAKNETTKAVETKLKEAYPNKIDKITLLDAKKAEDGMYEGFKDGYEIKLETDKDMLISWKGKSETMKANTPIWLTIGREIDAKTNEVQYVFIVSKKTYTDGKNTSNAEGWEPISGKFDTKKAYDEISAKVSNWLSLK